MPSLRTLLILGRISNLPTVWSNCLAGWWLAGGESLPKLILVMFGASLLYAGGMYLNDAFDAEFDAQYRRERPIPSGKITADLAKKIGFGLLVAGVATLFVCGLTAGLLGILMGGLMVFYNFIHKVVTISPLVTGVCRALVYPMAASVSPDGLNGMAVWCGIALGFYAAGVSFIARGRSRRGNGEYWPCAFLAVPIALALFMNRGDYFENALLLAFASLLWGVRCLRGAYAQENRNLGRGVAGLMTGMVLVDLLASLDVTRPMALIFLALMGLNVIFQRYAPTA